MSQHNILNKKNSLMNIHVKILAILLLLFSLSGCGIAGGGVAGIIGIATSFIMSDKLPTDNIAEIATGLDCSYVKHLDDEGPVCRSQDYGVVIEKPIYCYKTLGKVDCYDYPDPFNIGANHVE